jgi:hypothetical protein
MRPRGDIVLGFGIATLAGAFAALLQLVVLPASDTMLVNDPAPFSVACPASGVVDDTTED